METTIPNDGHQIFDDNRTYLSESGVLSIKELLITRTSEEYGEDTFLGVDNPDPTSTTALPL